VSDVRLLLACRSFATLDDHARQLGRDLHLGPDQVPSVRCQLASLADAGLLVSHANLLELCRQQPCPPSSPLRIAALGVPTRNRPDSLRRCLTSYAENGRQHGRANDFIVVDDSESTDLRRTNRQVLQELRDRAPGALFYAGPEERARYADALIRQAGLPVDAVRFALLNPAGCPVTTGASRNTLLLHTAGEMLLQVDDDTVCQLAAAPEVQGGLALSSQYDPTEFWFSAEGEPVLAGGAGVDRDFLAIHEQLLGKCLAECVGDAGTDLDFGPMNASFFRRLRTETPRVLVTAAGVAGDSGMGSSVYFLMLDGDSRARLHRSEGHYQAALASHQVMRAVTRLTVSDGGFCRAVNLGLDNRQLLPPFLPVQRNQDGVFGTLLRSCFGGGLFGFLPWLLSHRPPTPRRLAPDHLWQSIAGVTTGQVFQLLAGALAPGPGPKESGQRLRALGQSLAEWGAAPAADFEEMVRLHLWNHLGRQAALLESQLTRYGGWPPYWADDARMLLAALREALPLEHYVVPADLRGAFGLGEARAAFQGLVRQFGQLLQVWPDMVEAAKGLRARGIRPAESA
jgi:hypothetical protein